MIIFDNFVPENLQKTIEEKLIYDRSVEWIFLKNTVENYNRAFKNVQDVCQFEHIFYMDRLGIVSKHFDLIIPLLQTLEEKANISVSDKALRIKANLLLKQPINCGTFHRPHVDYINVPTTTLLYYVNETDGDTIIFKEKENTKKDNLNVSIRNTPKKGSAILFNSSYLHSSSSPEKNDFRVVVNIVLKKFL